MRTVRGQLEVCRQLTPDEREALPAHMRGATECDSYPITYRLQVMIDGRTALDEHVEPGGLRRDRPHNLDRELTLEPGSAALEVRFEPVWPDDASREMEPAFAGLPTYALDRTVRLEPDRITLIYLDDSSGTLEVVGP